MREFLARVAVAIVCGAVGALIAVWLAFRRFRAERWWDRKATTYASILEALHQVKRGTESNLEECEGGPRNTDEDRRKELIKRYRLAWDEISKAVDMGSFILSKEARRVLDALMEDIHRADEGVDRPNFNVYEALSARLAAINKCLEALPVVAKKDLSIG